MHQIRYFLAVCEKILDTTPTSGKAASNEYASGPDKSIPTDHLMVENRRHCLQEGAHAPLLLRTSGRICLDLLDASRQAHREVFRHGRAMRPGNVSNAGRHGGRASVRRALRAASSWAEKAFRDLPSFLMAVGIIAASHALAGRLDEARRAMDHLRRLDATLRISNLEDLYKAQQPL
jgi:hypothetical protein